MLLINRKFKVEIRRDHIDEFRHKLHELCIYPNVVYTEGRIKYYYEFEESQETMDELMEYLRNEFTGTATVSY